MDHDWDADASEGAAVADELAWRRVHEMAVAATISRLGHDLRGLLAPAMLVSERLQGNDDPLVRRSSETMLRCIERAAERLREGIDMAREGRPAVTRAVVRLRDLVEQARERCGACPPLVVEHDVDPSLALLADAALLRRVLSEWLRHATETGASRVAVTATFAATELLIVLTDDGRGLADGAPERALLPDHEHGRFGLAIIRDAVRAHDGQASVERTGPDGTVIRLALPRNLVRPDG